MCSGPIEKNRGLKRPALGKSPMQYWELIGKMCHKNYDTDDNI